MKIALYPEFEEVFADNQLKGIFYPLCSLTLATNEKIHFVSHNGLWTQCHSLSTENTDAYIRFIVTEGKYEFEGDIGFYKGYQSVPEIYQHIAADFERNGAHYLEVQMKTEDYITKVMPLITPYILEEFDIETYLSFFYTYQINKLNFMQHGQFGAFMHILYGYAKPDISPIIYRKGEELFDHAVENSPLEDEIPTTFDITKFTPVGLAVGMEFFTDGNDCLVYYNAEDQEVLCTNVYS